jgi:hypothetical protein
MTDLLDICRRVATAGAYTDADVEELQRLVHDARAARVTAVAQDVQAAVADLDKDLSIMALTLALTTACGDDERARAYAASLIYDG